MKAYCSIAITGATGFIGKAVTQTLSAKFRHNIVAVFGINDNTKIEIQGRQYLNKIGYKTVKSDFTKKSTIPKMDNVNVVIHLAANTNTSTKDHSVNDEGTINFFSKLNIDRSTHIIFTGTTAIFSGRIDCTKKLTECSTPCPTNEYSRSKLRAEKYLINLSRKTGCKLTILRLPTVYGPGARSNSFFEELKRTIKHGDISTRLNWQGLSDFVHVLDVAETIKYFVSNPPTKSRIQIFTLTSEHKTLADVSKMMHHKMGIKYNPIVLPITFWKLVKLARLLVPIFEHFTPPSVYNIIWRASIISNNVIWCDDRKITMAIKKWKPRKLESSLSDMF